MVKLNKLASIFIISIIMLSGLIPLINAPVLPGTYYGNFTHATEITSIGIVRKWLVNNQTLLNCIYTNGGSGSINYNPTSISNGKLFNVTSGIYSNIDFYKSFTSLDITKYIYLSFNYQGDIQKIDIIDFYCPDWTNRYELLNYYPIIGLNNILLTGFILGTASLSNTQAFDGLILSSTLGYSWSITNLKITTLYYYEIWDGATLKYQSTIEPDIFDFVQQPTLIDSTVNVPGIISVSEVDNPVITFDTWLIILFVGLIFAILSTQIRIHIMALLPLVMTCWGIINWNMYPNIILLNCIIWVLTLLFSIVAISEI